MTDLAWAELEPNDWQVELPNGWTARVWYGGTYYPDDADEDAWPEGAIDYWKWAIYRPDSYHRFTGGDVDSFEEAKQIAAKAVQDPSAAPPPPPGPLAFGIDLPFPPPADGAP